MNWIKTAWGAVSGFVSGASWTWALWLALGAAAVGGVAHWHLAGVKQARADGAASVRADYLAAENRALINQQERIATLSTELMEAQNAYSKAKADLATAFARADARGQRVRNATPAGGELDQRLGAASCEVARTFAARAFRAAQSCRDDIAEVGLGAGGLVESSASAHYEHARADALMQFAMPKSPFTKDSP